MVFYIFLLSADSLKHDFNYPIYVISIVGQWYHYMNQCTPGNVHSSSSRILMAPVVKCIMHICGTSNGDNWGLWSSHLESGIQADAGAEISHTLCGSVGGEGRMTSHALAPTVFPEQLHMQAISTATDLANHMQFLSYIWPGLSIAD